jgi:hypothetical protein
MQLTVIHYSIDQHAALISLYFYEGPTLKIRTADASKLLCKGWGIRA